MITKDSIYGTNEQITQCFEDFVQILHALISTKSDLRQKITEEYSEWVFHLIDKKIFKTTFLTTIKYKPFNNDASPKTYYCTKGVLVGLLSKLLIALSNIIKNEEKIALYHEKAAILFPELKDQNIEQIKNTINDIIIDVSNFLDTIIKESKNIFLTNPDNQNSFIDGYKAGLNKIIDSNGELIKSDTHSLLYLYMLVNWKIIDNLDSTRDAWEWITDENMYFNKLSHKQFEDICRVIKLRYRGRGRPPK